MYRLISYVHYPRPGWRFGPLAGPHQPTLELAVQCAAIESLNVDRRRIFVEETKLEGPARRMTLEQAEREIALKLLA